ncbi:MAG: NFACT family protein [Oscillospiraceae bacterium]|nr:NFACT family protein [Oscillospiraceae bacterium]
MALDGTYLHIIKNELSTLIGGRVEKIHQPSREEIIISMRTRSGGVKLLISASAASARVHITEQPAENPKVPPMFCMLLRKHLNCGRLTAVRQDGLERILYLDFEAVNELGDVVTITLACEIMGKYSNMIVINSEGKIIDSIKRVDDEMSRERLVLPGMRYQLPPRDERLNFLECEKSDIIAAIEKQKAVCDMQLPKALIKIFEGISPVLAREWVFYAARGEDVSLYTLTEDICDRLCYTIKRTREAVLSGDCHFTVIKDKDGMLKDFCFTEIHQYGALMITKELPSAAAALDYFYTQRDSISRMKQRANDLYRLLLNSTDRISRRLAAQKEELAQSAEREVYKLKGDLISANIYRIEKGMGSIETENFYSEEMETIKIELDRRLTPSQNMQKYYAEYRKADTAEKILTEQIAKGEEELMYIESVFDALTRAQGEDEIGELRAELAEQGYIRAQRGKSKPPKSKPPLMFTSPDGYRVAVGRNNLQNDKLTMKTAEKTDIWLHTKDIPGSHVIIFAEGTAVPDETIMFAARLAAYHSKAKSSSQVPVDYVPVKLVKKPAGSKPGKVIFTGNRTLYVKPFEDDEIKEYEGIS